MRVRRPVPSGTGPHLSIVTECVRKSYANRQREEGDLLHSVEKTDFLTGWDWAAILEITHDSACSDVESMSTDRHNMSIPEQSSSS